MGIDGSSRILYVSDALELTHIIAILRDRCQQTSDPTMDKNNENGRVRQPCIVIDGNQVGMRMMKSPGSAMHRIMAISELFASEGIDVIIAVDGERRPQTKRASVQRAANREHARIEAIIEKQDLAVLLQHADASQKKIRELQQLIKTNESLCEKILPDDFVDVLRELVETYGRQNKQSTISLKVAKMQADPMIARLLLTGKADLIVSSDSDFAAYAGDKCLCVKSFSYQGNRFDEIILSTGDRTVAEAVLASLRKTFPKATQTFCQPTFPIFCGENDPMFRALICVGLGCDVIPGGVVGLGPSRLYKAVQLIGKDLLPDQRIHKLLDVLTSFVKKMVQSTISIEMIFGH